MSMPTENRPGWFGFGLPWSSSAAATTPVPPPPTTQTSTAKTDKAAEEVLTTPGTPDVLPIDNEVKDVTGQAEVALGADKVNMSASQGFTKIGNDAPSSPPTQKAETKDKASETEKIETIGEEEPKDPVKARRTEEEDVETKEAEGTEKKTEEKSRKQTNPYSSISRPYMAVFA